MVVGGVLYRYVWIFIFFNQWFVGTAMRVYGSAKDVPWLQSHTLPLASTAAAIKLASEIYASWRGRCPEGYVRSLVHVSRKRAVHREAGRVVKCLSQISTWLYHCQQFRADCRHCNEPWRKCCCKIHIHPCSWQSSCDIEVATGTEQRASQSRRQSIWQALRIVEHLKGFIYRDFLNTSHTRNDMKLASFLEAWEQKCGRAHSNSTGVLYVYSAPWSCQAYIGQTGGSGWLRHQQHRYTQLSRRETGKLYDQFNKTHISKYVFLPICDLSSVARVKSDRLFLEAQAIAMLRPTLNTQGMPVTGPRAAYHTEIVLPMKPRGRALMHLRGAPKSDASCAYEPDDIKLPSEPLTVGSWVDRVRMVTSTARRPLWQQRRQNESLIDTIRSWTPSFMMKMTRVAMMCLGAHSRAIYVHNLGRATGGFRMEKVDFHHVLCFASSFRLAVIRILRAWLCARRSAAGVVTLARVTFRPKASPNLIELCDNSRSLLSKNRRITTCACGDPAFNDYPKLDGHVCCTLRPLLRLHSMSWLESWNARSRFLPSAEDAVAAAMDIFGPIGARLHGGNSDDFFTPSALLPVCTAIMQQYEATPDLAAAMHLHGQISRFACLPVDRSKGDMGIVCPMQYYAAAERFLVSAGCEQVARDDEAHYNADFFVWPNQMQHLPYCHLRRGTHHRFAALSLHIKAKCLFPLCTSWGDIKYRPLCHIVNTTGEIYSQWCAVRSITYAGRLLQASLQQPQNRYGRESRISTCCLTVVCRVLVCSTV